jgi:hypothetical protein
MLDGELIWDATNEEHIAGHLVVPEEVEETCSRPNWLLRARGGRIAIYGQSEAGRYLVVILQATRAREYYVITARDMEDSEQRRYRRWMSRRRR